MPFKTKIQTNFNRAAHSYNQSSHIQRLSALHLMQLIYKFLPVTIPDIVEIGCGTGHLTECLAQHYLASTIYAADLAKNMVNYCQQQLSTTLYPKAKVHFMVSDGELLPISSVHLIASNLAFQWFTNFEHSLVALAAQTNYLAFSLPVAGTFAAWLAAHQQLNIPYHGLDFPVYSKLLNLCKQLGLVLYSEVKDYPWPCANLATFTKNIKHIGANIGTNHYTFAELKALSALLNNGFAANYSLAFMVIKT